jgi:hypothetical protein
MYIAEHHPLFQQTQDKQPFIFERQRFKDMLVSIFQNNVHVGNIAERMYSPTTV